MRPLVLTLLTLTAVGCRTTAAPPEPTPTPPAEAEGGGGPEHLERARARWAVAGPDDYRFTVGRICFCPPALSGPFEVVVRDGRVASVTRDGQPVGPDAPALPTVEGMFDAVTEAYASSADEVRVRYDERLGYPVEIYVDEDFQAADEETGYTVSALVVE